MHKKLILLVGPVGCGKSTFAQNYIEENPQIIRICPDEFRALYGKDESDQSVNHLVFVNLSIFVEYLLKNNHSVLIDATNYNKRNRETWVNLAKTHGAQIICYVFDVTMKICKMRNAKRSRVVPESVIEKQFKNYEAPDDKEYNKLFYLNENFQIFQTKYAECS